MSNNISRVDLARLDMADSLINENKINIKLYESSTKINQVITKIVQNHSKDIRSAYSDRLLNCYDNIISNIAMASVEPMEDKHTHLLIAKGLLELFIQLVRLGVTNQFISIGSYEEIANSYKQVYLQLSKWYAASIGDR